MILIHNPDLSYHILGISHDAGSPRMCGLCMNRMDHPVEKWQQQEWMNSYEMASIWNAVRKGRNINQDIMDAIVGLMERTIDRLAALHEQRQAEPEFIDETWYRNAGQAYAYIAKLIVLIVMWEGSLNDTEMRDFLKKTPFIVTKPRAPGMTRKQMKAMPYGRRPKKTKSLERAQRDDWEITKSDGSWFGQRRRAGKLDGCENRDLNERIGQEAHRV